MEENLYSPCKENYSYSPLELIQDFPLLLVQLKCYRVILKTHLTFKLESKVLIIYKKKKHKTLK
jgi:hypothetical protein